MQLISERGVNLHFFPMVNARGRIRDSKTIIFKNIESQKPIFIAHKDSRWTYSCYKMMDFIASKLREQFIDWYREMNDYIADYPNKDVGLNPQIRHLFPMLHKPKEVIKSLQLRDNFTNLIKTPYTDLSIDFTINDLNKSGIFKAIHKSEATTLLDTISNCRVKTIYKINSEKPTRDKFGNNQFGYHFGFDNLLDDYQTLFEYKRDEENKRYHVSFNSIIGACFIHNTLTGGYQIIEEPFYSLTQPANIFYRLRFFVYGRLPKCHIYFQNFAHVMGITLSNPYMVRKRFERVIEELVDNNLINILSRPNKDKFEVSRFRNSKKVIQLKQNKV